MNEWINPRIHLENSNLTEIEPEKHLKLNTSNLHKIEVMMLEQ